MFQNQHQRPDMLSTNYPAFISSRLFPENRISPSHQPEPDSDIPELYPQEHFSHFYTIECKRSERTRKPFLLLLVNISSIYRSDLPRFIEPVITALTGNKREYDYLGWYRTGEVIGVIYPDYTPVDPRSIHERLVTSLQKSIGHAPTGMLSLSMYRITGTVRECINPVAGEHRSLLNEHSSLVYPSSMRKRFIDIMGALFGILFFAPAFIVLALLVKLTSKGPVFFRQERVGKNGEPFTMLKFRSMYVNNNDSQHREFVAKLIKGEIDAEANKSGEKIYKIKNDPRVTPIGRFLRKTSLDEIPQFFNVLRGEMSLVGPRPAIRYEVDQYDLWHRRRIIAKPGITGFWQVAGRSLTTFDGMVRMDIRYIQKGSFVSDLLLIFRTPFVLLGSKGAC